MEYLTTQFRIYYYYNLYYLKMKDLLINHYQLIIKRLYVYLYDARHYCSAACMCSIVVELL